VVQAVEAFRVLLAHGGQDERAEEGQPDLSAVRVAGEHNVDERTARVGEDIVGVIGLVRHEDDRAVGFGGNGEIEVGMAGAGVVDAAEPEAVAHAFDGEILIDQDRSAIGEEGCSHHGSVEGNVVVAEDAVTQGSGEVGENLGAAMEGVAAGDEGEGAVCDEVAGEKNEIGTEGIDLLYDAFKEKGFGVLVEVDVAELDDAIAMEGRGQIVDGDGALDDVEFVTGELAGVERQSGGCHTCADEEVSAGKLRRLWRGDGGHMS